MAQLDTIEKKVDDLVEIVGFIKDRMVTKEDLKEELDPIKADISAIKGAIDGIDRRIDREAEERFNQGVRIATLEKKI